MEEERWLKKCDCGYGPGWYHQCPQSTHEYNPEADEDRGTKQFWAARRSPGYFQEHNSCKYVAADISDYINNPDDGYPTLIILKHKNFYFNKYESELDAFDAAAKWVMSEVDAMIKEKQCQLFPEAAL